MCAKPAESANPAKSAKPAKCANTGTSKYQVFVRLRLWLWSNPSRAYLGRGRGYSGRVGAAPQSITYLCGCGCGPFHQGHILGGGGGGVF